MSNEIKVVSSNKKVSHVIGRAAIVALVLVAIYAAVVSIFSLLYGECDCSAETEYDDDENYFEEDCC